MKKLIFTLLFLVGFAQVHAQLSLDVETGLAFQGYNDVRIPNESSATEFDFNDDFDLQTPVVPIRVRVGYRFAEKNLLSVLYAPLSIDYKGPAPFDISFQGNLFSQGQDVDGLYKFNSYRLTYRRDLVMTERWILGLGFTAKIRDARVKLSTDDMSAKKDDIGFVPLLNIFAAYDFGGWALFLEGDGLAGGPGRAFDFFVGGDVSITENLSIKAGYRFLEGGADVDEVYNFTLIQFADVGFVWQL